mmetsp:Transcript_11003/g.36167  ORF Transcript_11003/g.36167 Transcript_11003/m.36167 type:complete len:204 (+) Transcript_11003:2133-2744(+)
MLGFCGSALGPEAAHRSSSSNNNNSSSRGRTGEARASRAGFRSRSPRTPPIRQLQQPRVGRLELALALAAAAAAGARGERRCRCSSRRRMGRGGHLRTHPARPPHTREAADSGALPNRSNRSNRSSSSRRCGSERRRARRPPSRRPPRPAPGLDMSQSRRHKHPSPHPKIRCGLFDSPHRHINKHMLNKMALAQSPDSCVCVA